MVICPSCGFAHAITVGSKDELRLFRAMGEAYSTGKGFFCNPTCYERYLENRVGITAEHRSDPETYAQMREKYKEFITVNSHAKGAWVARNPLTTMVTYHDDDADSAVDDETDYRRTGEWADA